MAFGFGKKKNKATDADQAPEAVAAPTDAGAAGAAGVLRLPPGPADEAYDRALHGPLDESEITSTEGYVDLGALLVTPREGLSLRLEVEENTSRVIAVTLDLNGSSLQLQAFAASRSEKLWRDIREQIGLSVGSQGGEIEILDGTFGKEVLAKVPAQGNDGSKGFRVARFIGIDGPRWFLRGVLGGEAAMKPEAAGELEDLFRGVVVVRGETPLPPRDLLLLRLPKDAVAGPQPGAAQTLPGQGVPPQGGEQLRRGPEITAIG
ncbi:DUF3710 domain-containing protein [Specibacter sp. NPDC057265]|uniref:DUF3710 domain-containing protein n=1 Tax=Specibacter sp. NPDC057265 TaxID=3346075 RepID=UPI003626101F